MSGATNANTERLWSRNRGTVRPPAGRGRVALALLYGLICHATFALAVLAMIVAMFFGMTESPGRIPAPWFIIANAALVLQFPIVHSLLLTGKGNRWLARLAPGGHGRTLGTPTYAIITSVQLLALFALWTPSGIVWWRAEGWIFGLICALHAGSWLLLVKASYDAGANVQSGALGWMSLVQDKAPIFPDMPTGGLFRVIRQPIYVAFALTLWTVPIWTVPIWTGPVWTVPVWTVPVWTPDQLAMALTLTLTAYCLIAPRFVERRFERRYADRFRVDQQTTPYAVPAF